MLVQVVGKRHFSSSKTGKDYYMLSTLYQDPSVEGWAVKERFVNAEIFNQVSPGHKYDFVFRESFDGKAVVDSVHEVNNA